MATISIIIPTWNNPQFLIPCIQSIHKQGILASGLCELIVVDNGSELPVPEGVDKFPNTRVLKPGKNLGWEGGLKLGLAHSKAPFVCFQNDDTLLPVSSIRFYERLLMAFADPDVAAVGPSSTTVAGIQSILHPNAPIIRTEVPWLIFFCVMVRREHLDLVGGVDTTLSGGDDLDLSIRFRNAGKKLIVEPHSFIIHHGFVTGNRVHGDHTVKNGWNNVEFTDKTNIGLIRKHGFRKFIENRFTAPTQYAESRVTSDIEGDIIRGMVNGDKNILELGCGGQKTVERAIGVDIIPNGQDIPNLIGIKSVADVVCDIQKNELPFEPNSQDTIIARHTLEHAIDLVSTIKNWRRVLKVGGHLILAVPDEKVTYGIPLNPEHCHAFTTESLGNFMETQGFKRISEVQSGNGVSLVGCYEKC